MTPHDSMTMEHGPSMSDGSESDEANPAAIAVREARVASALASGYHTLLALLAVVVRDEPQPAAPASEIGACGTAGGTTLQAMHPQRHRYTTASEHVLETVRPKFSRARTERAETEDEPSAVAARAEPEAQAVQVAAQARARDSRSTAGPASRVRVVGHRGRPEMNVTWNWIDIHRTYESLLNQRCEGLRQIPSRQSWARSASSLVTSNSFTIIATSPASTATEASSFSRAASAAASSEPSASPITAAIASWAFDASISRAS
eukprot:CAMPEP_0185190208 /NCGR_PEP_ID=MMETSP1140-20130426/6517_1 /TAXON_ID=298111 /ORGANISM="Pavlova sp., Strain CCMP459" /LENGTH=261 /DNA_ID=CAMNT_0027756819 /DNA_START=208 /DNA_END=1000 /DNA_ORIENTATION=-